MSSLAVLGVLLWLGPRKGVHPSCSLALCEQLCSVPQRCELCSYLCLDSLSLFLGCLALALPVVYRATQVFIMFTLSHISGLCLVSGVFPSCQ